MRVFTFWVHDLGKAKGGEMIRGKFFTSFHLPRLGKRDIFFFRFEEQRINFRKIILEKYVHYSLFVSFRVNKY